MNISVVTAREALADNMYPSAFLSIARIQDGVGNHAAARHARAVAHELAGMRGIDLGGRRRRRSGQNDNANRSRASHPRRTS